MDIREAIDGELVILSPSGEWDAEASPFFRERAFALAAKGYKYFAVDFREITFIDSSALASLVSLFKKINPTLNGDLFLFGLNDGIRGIFRETRLDRVFDIFATCEEAKESLRKKVGSP